MKFKGEPNLYVKLSNKYIQRVTGIKGFHFDANGEYETENETLIKLLNQYFKVKEEIEKINVEEAKEVEITGEEVKVEVKEEVKETLKYKCKKCDYKTNNMGELLAHYREFHPKVK